MTRHESNDVFANTSFLEGANASYLAELHARYQEQPHSLDPAWREFFASLDDDPDDVLAEASGPSWAPSNGAASVRAALPQLPTDFAADQDAVAAARDSI